MTVLGKRHRSSRYLAVLCWIVLADSATFSAGQGKSGGTSMAYLDKIPLGTLSEMTDATKSVGFPGLTWPTPVVTVGFNGGDSSLYALIESTASEWTANGGRLRFSFRRSDGSYRTWSESDVSAAADIRIGFFTDKDRNGYWSAVGTLARRVNASEATMNFGGLGTSLSQYYGGANQAAWNRSYEHGTVLHEFGHAIGLNHEHFHPECQADLKLQQAVSWLMGPPNSWKLEQAMFNLDANTYFKAMATQTGSSPVSMTPKIDQASIMLYSFPDNFFKSGAKSPCRPSSPLHYATVLSAEDRHYYADNYGSAK